MKRFLLHFAFTAVTAMLTMAVCSARPLPPADTSQTVKIHKVNEYKIAPDPVLDSLVREIGAKQDKILRVWIGGSASPEGPVLRNLQLGERRARGLADYILQHTGISESLLKVEALGEDWDMVVSNLDRLPDFPNRGRINDIISTEPDWDGRKSAIRSIDQGHTWNRLISEVFPSIRNSRINITLYLENIPAHLNFSQGTLLAPPPSNYELFQAQIDSPKQVEKSRYFSARSNLLHDVIAVPNIGVEVWLGSQFTLYIDYSAAWWGNRMSSTYNAGRHVWRYEGGNVEIRRYFGKTARQKPLTGWHAGVYGQVASYDFQWGDVGKQGRKPSYGAGLSAGYQLPIAKRWNLDFSFAVGYFGGEYKTCHFMDGHNVWVNTRQRHYVGPTRLEVSLVWLLGRGNENKEKAKKKGGRHE